MNKTLKRVICICLCAVLMFGIFTAPIVQPKADAFAITATAGMIAIGVTLLTMLGITFASVGAAEQASKSLLEGSQDIFDWVNDLSLQGGSGGEPGDGKWFKLGATTMAGLATFVNKARELFGNSANSGSVSVVDYDFRIISNAVVYTGGFDNNGWTNWEQLYNLCSYTYSDLVEFDVNGHNYEYYMKPVYHNDSMYYLIYASLDDFEQIVSLYGSPYVTDKLLSPNTMVDCHYGFASYEYLDEIYILPFVGYKCVDENGDVFYTGYRQDSIPNTNTKMSSQIQYGGASHILVTGFSTSPYYTDTYYQNVSPYELNILYNALAEKLQTQEITFDYTDTLDQIENHSEEQLQVSQDQLLEQAQIKDLLEQIKAGQGGTTKTELQEKDLNIPETHNLTWKFPFCVPFDLIALVGALNATPKDPKWEIPFHIESLGFDDSITLDLTTFEPVTVVFRVVTTIAFLLGLIIVTRKMIQG